MSTNFLHMLCLKIRKRCAVTAMAENICTLSISDCMALSRYGFMPHRVAFWIYWEALQLLLLWFWGGVSRDVVLPANAAKLARILLDLTLLSAYQSCSAADSTHISPGPGMLFKIMLCGCP